MAEQRDQGNIALKRISRRRLLVRTGLGAAGLLVAIACGDSSDDGESNESAAAADTSTTSGCPAETVSQIPPRTSGGDPVNLVFYASTASPAFAAGVKDILRNASDPWTSPGLLHLQLPAVDDYICRSGDSTRDDEQAVKPIDWRSRYHVRLWNYEGAAAATGSAHAETVSLRFTHEVTSFDAGKHEVALALREAGWTAQEDSLRLRENDPPKDNGNATELSR